MTSMSLLRAVVPVRAPTAAVHIVIVNWNAGDHLRQCLKSFASSADDVERIERITVVDNGSTDASLRDLDQAAIGLPLSVIQNAENIGFAAACNRGALESNAEFLLFLNPDVLLRAGSLGEPIRFLTDAANGAVGIVGIQLLGQDGCVTRSCARRPTWRAMIGQSLGLDRLMPSLFPPHFLLGWDHGDTRPVDQVMGAFYLVRRSMFDALGGFDERFFVYFEDLDMALRAKASGWTSVYLACAQAVHVGGGTTRGIKDRRLFYWWRSRMLYALKHFGVLGGGAVAVATTIAEPIVRAVAALATLRVKEVGTVARAYAWLWADLPNIVRAHHRLATTAAVDG